MNEQTTIKFELLKRQNILYELWIKELSDNKIMKNNSEEDARKLSTGIFNAFIKIFQHDSIINLEDKEFEDVRAVLEGFSKTIAARGETPTTTVMYIYSLKAVLAKFLQTNNEFSEKAVNEEILRLQDILDKMVLHTFEYFVKQREKIIQMQQEDMMELSTPVIKVWNGILAIPLIGTIDSKRTQIVMEKLLDTIIATSSKIAILDMAGVPTVDTYVANHLINTTKAARLLGSEIIITGISPNIAQIMVHLDIDLSGIITRALMQDGLKLALEMCDYRVTKVKNP